MRRALLLSAGLLVGLTLLAPAGPVRAQGLLPDCEKTLYQVEKGGTKCPDGANLCVNPDDYTEGANGKITGVMVNRNCGFSDFIQVFVNLANWGLGIMAVLALFFYLYGGFTLLISGGRKEYVENGKKILIGTTVGVIVMLTAWALIGFYVIATTGSTKGFVFPNIPEQAPWFGKATGCRERYALEHNQSACGQNNLRLYCADKADVDQGPVTQLQSLLAGRECSPGAIDGCFGSETDQAVRLFERVNAMAEDGVVNEEFWQRLNDTTATVNCSDELGCCLTDVGGAGTTWDCDQNYPKTRCESEDRLFLSGQCPGYCSYW